MQVHFASVAEKEFQEAITWYNQQSEGLGHEFSTEIKQTLKRIQAHPDAWTLLSDNTRRCRTNRFPYGVIYRIKDDTIFVIAIMHTRRKPRIWQDF